MQFGNFVACDLENQFLTLSLTKNGKWEKNSVAKTHLLMLTSQQVHWSFQVTWKVLFEWMPARLMSSKTE